jgi:uncharacterized phage-like protein YoqJ
LLVVFVVLTDIREPMEKSIISVLGIIYVAVRGIGIGQGLAIMWVANGLQEQIDRIRFAVDSSFEMPDRREELSAIEFARNKVYIDSFFLIPTSLVCLWQFFTAHS